MRNCRRQNYVGGNFCSSSYSTTTTTCWTPIQAGNTRTSNRGDGCFPIPNANTSYKKDFEIGVWEPPTEAANGRNRISSYPKKTSEQTLLNCNRDRDQFRASTKFSQVNCSDRRRNSSPIVYREGDALDKWLDDILVEYHVDFFIPRRQETANFKVLIGMKFTGHPSWAVLSHFF